MNVLYIISGRSFKKHKKGRKITSLIEHWQSKIGVELKLLFGGDISIMGKRSDLVVSDGKLKQKSTFTKREGFLQDTISEIRDILHDIKLYLHLRKQKHQPKIVWERSCRLHFLSLLYARQNKAIYVHEWIDNLLALYKYSGFKWLGHIVEGIKKKYSDFIVVPNEVIKDNLVEEGLDPDKIKVAYNAVDTTIFYPTPKKESEQFTVLYIGSFAFYHDMERLPKAIKLIQNKIPNHKINFKFIGDGIYLDSTKKMCLELNLKNVEFLERVGIAEVPMVINGGDVCVLPGTTDIICPIKIMEFMACGKAVILPDYKCNKEVITNGYDGITFTPFDEVDLADKIIWSFLNQEELNSIGQNAYKTCIERFTWKSTWGKILDEIQNDIIKSN